MLNGLYDRLIKVSSGGLKRRLIRFRLARSLMTSDNSYLNQTGYLDSKVNSSLKDAKGEYIPWMNYPIVAFFKKHLHKNIKVFEYGSGASTFFFAERCKSVVSIEHDQGWYEHVSKEINTLKNVDLKLVALDADYDKAIEKEGKFDFVVVDGRKRVECATHALDFLTEEGVVILDDSNRERYQSLFPFFENNGFRHLTFEGLKPTGFKNVTTTVFYRTNNCLNI